MALKPPTPNLPSPRPNRLPLQRLRPRHLRPLPASNTQVCRPWWRRVRDITLGSALIATRPWAGFNFAGEYVLMVGQDS